MDVRAETARRRVKRASGLLREAVADLAGVVGGEDVLGTLRVHDAQTQEDVAGLIELGIVRYGAVEVVVIARPSRRANSIPTTAVNSAKENHDATAKATSSAGQT
jgi:hypothetical protein